MLGINNLHATVGDKLIHKGLSLALAASLLTACGDASVGDVKAKVEDVKGKAADATALLDPAALIEKLPPEAGAVVTSYKRDLQAAADAHLAQYGQLPASLADLTSLAGARETAINTIADGLAEQVPFASRETLEKAANGVVATVEKQILSRTRTQDAPNP
jgi:catalase (peroxidase I)